MPIISINLALHLLAVVVWVGGMFFAHQVLRPAAVEQLEPPQRLPLWVAVFRRFFPWVWVSVTVVPATGYWMIFNIFQGFAGSPLYVHVMNGIGLLMIAVYLFVFFVPYAALKRAVTDQDWPAGGKALATIRKLVGFNLLLGLATIVVAGGGRYLGLG